MARKGKGRIEAKNVQEFEPGKNGRIIAQIIPRQMAARFKMMRYECMNDPSLIEKNGTFHPPQVAVSTNYTIKVTAKDDPDEKVIKGKVVIALVRTAAATATATATTNPTPAGPTTASLAQQARGTEIVLLQDIYSVDSGGSITVSYVINNGKKGLKIAFAVEGEHGEVDSRIGKYTAPILDQDASVRIKAFFPNDLSIAAKYATIHIKKAKQPKIYIYKKVFLAKSGVDKIVKLEAEIRRWIKDPKSFNPKPKIIFAIEYGEGEIDDRGVFQVPLVYEDKQTVIRIIASEGLTDKIEVVPETVTINIQKAPLPVIHLLKKVHTIESGGKVKVLAWIEVRGWNEKRPKPRLSVELKRGEGEVDSNGVYLSEVTDEDDEAVVTIFTPEELTGGFSITPIDVTIKILKKEIAEIQPSKELKLGAKTEIKFKAKSDFAIHPKWQIIDPTQEKGTINSDTGLYQTPDLIKSEMNIQISMTDLFTGKKADPVTVALKPVSLVDKDAEAGTVRTTNAGDKPIELNILSYCDPEGLKNFTLKIIKPFGYGGKIIEETKYQPPLRVSQLLNVLIEAVSKFDQTKKLVYKVNIDFPKCKCGGKTDKLGICTACNMATTPGAFIKKRNP